MKKALIIGVAGQDGAYLSQLLLEKGYKVYGATRRSGSGSFWRHNCLDIQGQVEMVDMDIIEQLNTRRVIAKIEPDEVYNLAAQSFVGTSFDHPIYTGMVDGIAVTYLLETIREVNPKIKFYQASTSELFGKVQEIPQTEKTPFYPRSPYGIAKLYAHWMTKNYREAFNMHVCSGILFNHESPLRGHEFVTRKITIALTAIKLGKQDVLELGNTESRRDWGFAGDYVKCMYLMMQAKVADDYVFATNKTWTIKQFVELAGKELDMDIVWEGENENTIGIDRKTGKTIVRVNPKFYRPAEVELLIGDPAKAEKELGWSPKVQLPELVSMMVKADMDRQINDKIAEL